MPLICCKKLVRCFAQNIILVYYNLGFIFIVLFSYNNIVFTKVIAEIQEHDGITTINSDGARNMSSQTIARAVNKPTV